MAEKKPGGLVIALGKPGAISSSDDAGGDDPKVNAANALISAIKAGDAAAVAEIFGDMQTLCATRDEGGDYEE
jgi:hypothetical protein